MIKDTYKSRTSKDKNDTNIPLSVQPWGEDGDKRKYWLIEGQDDTAFRVYRESDLTARKNPDKDNTTWWSSAGSIDELRVLAQKLADEDGTRKAKTLSERILNAIPRFEATEEVCADSLSSLPPAEHSYTLREFKPEDKGPTWPYQALLYLAGVFLDYVCTVTDDSPETQAPRVPPQPQSRLHSTRPRFLPLRNPHARQANEIHVLR